VAEMNFLPDSMKERINCYRVLDDDGRTISGSRFQEVRCCSPHHFEKFSANMLRGKLVLKTNLIHPCQVSKELALKMYTEMVTLQIMDTIFYEAQRQGRISFYLTSNGEEAINIASAAALSMDDIVLPQVQHKLLHFSEA
jgi:2-oxoisovalerate dehydrogenase E1 component alpha subunit